MISFVTCHPRTYLSDKMIIVYDWESEIEFSNVCEKLDVKSVHLEFGDNRCIIYNNIIPIAVLLQYSQYLRQGKKTVWI